MSLSFQAKAAGVGALAGLAGMSEISGVVHRLQERISPQYGFTGIIIAWVAKLNPFAVVLVSVLFGALIVAGREIQPSGLAAPHAEGSEPNLRELWHAH